MSRYFIYCLLFVLQTNVTVSCKMQFHDEKETAGGWIKYDSNPSSAVTWSALPFIPGRTWDSKTEKRCAGV